MEDSKITEQVQNLVECLSHVEPDSAKMSLIVKNLVDLFNE